MEDSFGQQVKAALATITGEVTIAEAEAHVRDVLNGLIEQRGSMLASEALKAIIRKTMKMSRDQDGLCLWASIEVTDEEGEVRRVYKQMEFFDKNDFACHIQFHSDRTEYHARTANSLTRKANRKLGLRRQLPFPDFGYLVEKKADVA